MLANSNDNGASRNGKEEAGDEQLRKQSGEDKTKERPLSGSSRKADSLQQFKKNIPDKKYSFPPELFIVRLGLD